MVKLKPTQIMATGENNPNTGLPELTLSDIERAKEKFFASGGKITVVTRGMRIAHDDANRVETLAWNSRARFRGKQVTDKPTNF